MTRKAQDEDEPVPQASSGALLLRVWTEDETESRLRVRITELLEPDADPAVLATAGSIDEVCAVVGAWLEEFLSASRGS